MSIKTLFWATAATATLAMSASWAQDDAMLANPPDGDWLTYGRAVDNYRHSPLTQITPENVGQLQLVWARGLEAGSYQGSPIVHDGVMYIPNAGDVIQAVDAATGDLIWEHRRQLGDTMLLHSIGDRKRGIALYDGKVYFSSWDNHLVALDAASGQVVFDIDRGQGTDLVSNTSGPIIANGVVVLGSTCQYSPFGCFVTGHDAATGEELWRNTFIPRPGEEGDETWGGSDYESRWMTGVWGQLTYDPVLDLVYYGSSSTGPASEVQRGTVGGSQYGTNTRFAVRPATGEVVWRHQTLPRDNWDQECTFEMIAADTTVNPSPEMDGFQAMGPNATGERRVVTGVPCKTGIFWQFDAATGEFMYARDTVLQTIVESIDETGLVTVNEEAVLSEIGVENPFCPSYLGGRDWPSSTFNPETGIYFIPLTNICTVQTARDQEFTALDVYNVDLVHSLPEGVEDAGRIDAIDISTGETVWSYTRTNPLYAPLMSTASGLLFSPSIDRSFSALSQETGEVLWETRLAGPASGHPITYEVDGRQYVAIGGGGPQLSIGFFNPILDTPMDTPTVGSAMYVFALPEG